MSYQYFNICHQKALLLNGPKKWEAYKRLREYHSFFCYTVPRAGIDYGKGR